MIFTAFVKCFETLSEELCVKHKALLEAAAVVASFFY